MTGDTGGNDSLKIMRGKYNIPASCQGMAGGATLLLGSPPAMLRSQTYRSVVAESFRSLPYQLALPSSSSRRGGLKGLHVRNKRGGESWKVVSSSVSLRRIDLLYNAFSFPTTQSLQRHLTLNMLHFCVIGYYQSSPRRRRKAEECCRYRCF